MASNTIEDLHLARVSVFLPVRLRDDLERLARVNDRSLSGEVRTALREHTLRSALPPRKSAGGVSTLTAGADDEAP